MSPQRPLVPALIALVAVGVVSVSCVVFYRSASGGVPPRMASDTSAPAPSPQFVVGQTTATPNLPGPGGAVSTAHAQPSSSVPTAGAKPNALADVIGKVQPIIVDDHSSAQVKSVAEALTTHQHPERLNALIAPELFLTEKFQANPEAYANEVVPGRVYQTAAPGDGVLVLRSLGPTGITLSQDAETILRTQTKPFAAITYTSFDLGRFGNGLTSQTVIADAHGVASVSFTPGPGTIDAVHILAGSPAATGQVSFRVFVTASTQPSGKGI